MTGLTLQQCQHDKQILCRFYFTHTSGNKILQGYLYLLNLIHHPSCRIRQPGYKMLKLTQQNKHGVYTDRPQYIETNNNIWARLKLIQFIINQCEKKTAHTRVISLFISLISILLMLSHRLSSMLCIHTRTHTHTSTQLVLQPINIWCLLSHDFQ